LAELPEYAEHVAPLLERAPPRPRRVFDAAKVHDHHAIIPTGKSVRWDALGRDERRIFDLCARRFVGAFHPDAELAVTDAIVRVGAAAAEKTGGGVAAPPVGEGTTADDEMIVEPPPPPDRFHARGRVRLVSGWQAVAQIGDRGEDGAPAGEGDQRLPPLREGERLDGRFES